MAHFDAKSPLRTHRTFEYGSLAVLNFVPNCTHVRNSQTPCKHLKGTK
jgi:hypothetical protein